MKALALSQLTKTYKNGVQALKGIDLDVEEGDFYALLGPNGAGKTTAIGIVTSLVNKSSGSVKVFDYDIDTHWQWQSPACWCRRRQFHQFESVTTILVNHPVSTASSSGRD